MEEDIFERAKLYTAHRNRLVSGQLGSGIHGTVFETESNAHPGFSALKIHHEAKPYFREREIYERLKEHGIFKLLGFAVPQLLAWDDQLLALEITVVKPPYVLDFAGAWLDFPPHFSEEIWADWERKNEEQFGDDWPMAQRILAELEDLAIHMLDPSPSNIRFR
jgi:hypothetical protein